MNIKFSYGILSFSHMKESLAIQAAVVRGLCFVYLLHIEIMRETRGPGDSP
jgi:hypothetical protein